MPSGFIHKPFQDVSQEHASDVHLHLPKRSRAYGSLNRARTAVPQSVARRLGGIDNEPDLTDSVHLDAKFVR